MPRFAEHAQHIERQHVGRAFPDRVHLRVAQQLRDAGVLDVAGAAERLAGFRRDAHRELAGPELRQRRQQAQQRALVVARDCRASTRPSSAAT